MVRSMVLLSLIFLLLLCLRSSSFHSPSVNPSRIKHISWKPRAFVYEGFLADEECDHLISLAKSELKRSAVADNLSGKSTLSDVRTSSGMFVSKGKDDIVSGIEDRIAAWTFLPKGFARSLLISRSRDQYILPLKAFLSSTDLEAELFCISTVGFTEVLKCPNDINTPTVEGGDFFQLQDFF